ncbi:DNA-binding protein Alba [Candidatus Bathyarchaeota archaeon]|nr:DNA-binding protein Alba [Candidatus Bathyarchaeota archaeon]RLI10081.1 MAG: DNA-binding protein Alba [Candidatus Bathyarchaeota archaeon]
MAEEKHEETEKKEEAKETSTATQTTKTTAENTVLIGKKPVMNYVVACLTFFNSGTKKLIIKARGRAISRAVDTVELLRRAFVKDLQLQNIAIGTEEVERAEGQKTNVSTIEITVAKP